MTRPFFSMGPHKSRAAISSTATLRLAGSTGGGVVVAARTFSFAATSPGLRAVGSVVPGISSWDTGDMVFNIGESDWYDIAATGPSGYVTGGTYDVDQSGNPLPDGIELSAAGILADVGAAGAEVVNNVIFGYTEPNALSTLTLHSSASGTLPYLATVYPSEGAVPNVATIRSDDDLTLRSTVLSTWPDGSAQVAVLAGQTAVTSGGTKAIRLKTGPADSAPLTVARIKALVSSISVNFSGTQQTLTMSGAIEDWIWWQNSKVICARYRLGCGHGDMEAVIDIHAFDTNYAIVEVVIENSRTDCSAPTVAMVATQSYTNATVAVNGTTIATVSSPTVGMALPNSRKVGTYVVGNHEAFRAWYCSAEINGGVVTPKNAAPDTFGIEVTHDTASLQAHPWFAKPCVPSSDTPSIKYQKAYDTYVPWALCRLRIPGMNAGGDDISIGFLTETQADYGLHGDIYTRRAILAEGWAMLSTANNWRHLDGRLPTRPQMLGKNYGSNNAKWPATETNPGYAGASIGIGEASHIPCVGVIPFLCRPSPCFIEIAQKEFCFHAVCNNVIDAACTYEDEQVRARGWKLRNYAATVFLTPDNDYDGTGRKASLRAAIVINITKSNNWLDKPLNTLKIFDGYNNTSYASRDSYDFPDPPDSGSLQADMAPWMHHYIVISWVAVEQLKVLRGADQAAWTALCDKFCGLPVKYINDATAGEWRFVPYAQYLGVLNKSVNPNTIDMGVGNWAERNRIIYGEAVPAATGTWLSDIGINAGGWEPDASWAEMFQIVDAPRWSNANIGEGGGSYNFDAIFWAAFCAAVERGGAEADAAWAKVYGTIGATPDTAGSNAGITNFQTWRTGFRYYARWNRYPRNKL